MFSAISRKLQSLRFFDWRSGLTLGGWMRLLRRYGRPGQGALFFAGLTLISARNSLLRLHEETRFGARVRRTRIRPPVIILGYWRSGTTHLHNLFDVDERFAAPNHFEVFHPHTFLTTEERARRTIGDSTETRVQDNVQAGAFTPGEDEYALAAMASRSLFHGELFPAARPRAGRYLTFHDATAAERTEWKNALRHFVRKLTFKWGRPVVLKSPGHTARIRLLLETFPDARFVHIHRHPHSVFQSYEHLAIKKYGDLLATNEHGEPDESMLDEWRDQIIQSYAETYQSFFEERSDIPEERFAEVSFTALENDAVGTMRSVYEALDLPDFEDVEPALVDYVGSLKGYKKNRFPRLSPSIAQRLGDACAPLFEEWGYSAQ